MNECSLPLNFGQRVESGARGFSFATMGIIALPALFISDEFKEAVDRIFSESGRASQEALTGCRIPSEGWKG